MWKQVVLFLVAIVFLGTIGAAAGGPVGYFAGYLIAGPYGCFLVCAEIFVGMFLGIAVGVLLGGMTAIIALSKFLSLERAEIFVVSIMGFIAGAILGGRIAFIVLVTILSRYFGIS